MRSSRSLLSALRVLLLAAAVLAVACASDGSSTDDDLNYRSTAGQEFAITATIDVTADPATAALTEPARTKAILEATVALRSYVWSVFARDLTAAIKATNRKGPPLTIRHADAEATEVTPLPAPNQYRISLRSFVASIDTFLRYVPLKSEGSAQYFPTRIVDGVRFNQDVKFFFAVAPRSLNAYPRYLELMEGGIDIALHVGYDHHVPRQDIDHARSYYYDLLAWGFRPPVASFEALGVDSGAFTSSMVVKGKTVPIRLRLIHPNMGSDANLIASFKKSMKDADIVIYDGHASDDAVGVLVLGKSGRLLGPELKDVDVGTKQQLYFFNGCHTYSAYADRLLANPKRTTRNTDVMTAGNVVAIQKHPNQVLEFLHGFYRPFFGSWRPRSWDSILERVNEVGDRSWAHVYGVHGIDDNPKLSPLADITKNGVECNVDADCGDGDNRCVHVTAFKRACAVACADSSGCPSGTRCMFPKFSMDEAPTADDLKCLSR